jgi:tetrahydromethanopterin S-methyltransferase subunit C
MFNGISKRQTILTLWAFSFSFGVLSMMIVALETTKTQGAAAIISMMFWFFLFVKFIKMKFEEAC